MSTVGQQLRQGMIYALLFVGVGAAMGALYGVWSGLILAPAVFAVSLTGIFVVLNFPVALGLFLLNGLASFFGQHSLHLRRYFVYSVSFLVVYLLFFLMLKLLGIEVF